jgi:CYTH domain-containing protein
MAEIERKFLVDQVPAEARVQSTQRIRQGYLSVAPAEVRIRSSDDAAHELTVKSVGGLSRTEVTVPLTPEQFVELWELRQRQVEKTRSRVLLEPWTAEVDVYDGRLAGLVVAEVEFPSESDALAFSPPPWFGTEVTTDSRYRNVALAAADSPPAWRITPQA